MASAARSAFFLDEGALASDRLDFRMVQRCAAAASRAAPAQSRRQWRQRDCRNRIGAPREHTMVNIAAAGTNPLVQFLLGGATQGREPHPLFDSRWHSFLSTTAS